MIIIYIDMEPKKYNASEQPQSLTPNSDVAPARLPQSTSVNPDVCKEEEPANQNSSIKADTDCTYPDIEVDINSTYPDDAWEECYKMKMKNAMTVKQRSLFSDSAPADNVLRFVCMSDTHGRVERSDYAQRVPDGDILLHAGDFTMESRVGEFIAFNEFLNKLPHRVKLAIPGNHEIALDPRGYGVNYRRLRKDLGLPVADSQANLEETIQSLKDIVTEARILIDEMVEICGLKIYGLPWLPEYGLFGFGLPRGAQLLHKYNRCPPGIDILLSHGPALGFGDKTLRRKHVGCVELLNSVRKRIKPKYLVSGHIHEGYGVSTDGVTTYINCAACNKNYRPVQDPVVFDLPLPYPYTRDDFLAVSHNLRVTKPWKKPAPVNGEGT